MGKSKEALKKKKLALSLKKEKQQEKATKKKLKQQGEKDELSALLEQFSAKRREKIVTYGKFVTAKKPSPRANMTMTSLPSGDVFLFGGEFYDGANVTVFNETYRWNIERDEWKILEGNSMPQPRCSHQAVLHNDSIYIFGGEFSTFHQFHHFKDLWQFNLKTTTWNEVSCSGPSPTARSGHRMAVYKNTLILFGGFHDTMRETRYYNDLYILCLQSFVWTRFCFPSTVHCPSPRSGVILACYPQGNVVFVIGGYCKVKETNKGAQGKTLTDAWVLNMSRVNVDAKTKNSSLPVWEKLNKKASLPSLRSGMAAVTHKSLIICFGGVKDEDNGGLSLKSMFFNDMLAFDMERRRWFSLGLKKKKKNNKSNEAQKLLSTTKITQNIIHRKNVDETEEKEEDCFEDEDDIDERTFGYIDLKGMLVRIKLESCVEETSDTPLELQNMRDETFETDREKKEPNSSSVTSTSCLSASTAEIKVAVKPPQKIHTSQFEATGDTSLIEMDSLLPLPRFSPSIWMRNNDFFIYGGLMELEHKELTLDDCWYLNVNIRSDWVCISKGNIDEHPWNEKSDSDDDSSDSSKSGSYSNHDSKNFSDDSDSTNYDDTSTEQDNSSNDSEVDHLEKSANQLEEKNKKKNGHKKLLRDRMLEIEKKLFSIKHPIPESKEVLSTYFNRTKDYWVALHNFNTSHHTSSKNVRRDAFTMASDHFNAMLPLLNKIRRYETFQNTEKKDFLTT